MMNGTAMPSLADIAAVTNNNDSFGGNNGWWVLILLFAIFGGWGNGYGNGGTAENYTLASDFASLQRQIDSQTAVIARIDAMERNAMQDKIASLQAENQNLKFAASQQAQNAYLISQLGNNGCCGCNC